MAEENPEDRSMRPEQRIASRLLAERDVHPPVDVLAIAQEFADVEHDRIPTGADALLLYPSDVRLRPLIIVDANRPEVRTRFTLAHELGHIVIPWHVGELAYHQDWSGKLGDHRHRQMESEANRFAAELLMPTDWVRTQIERSRSFREMFQRIRRAKVSGPAACLAMVRCLPPGCVFAQIEKPHGSVVLSGKSEGTLAIPPSQGKVLPDAPYQRARHRHETVTEGGNVFHWWRFEDARAIAQPVYSVSWRDLLDRIYAECGVVGQQRVKLTRSVNGIINCASRQRPTNKWRNLYRFLKQRFADRESTIPIITHPDFSTFLALRAKEMASRNRAHN